MLPIAFDALISDRSPWKRLVATFKKPLIIAAVLGFFLTLCGTQMPSQLTSTFDLLGKGAGGVAIFAAGIVLGTRNLTFNRPYYLEVMATMNLNGDYLSDALTAQVGGLGIAPSSNINFQTGAAIFEATHGTAPQPTGKGLANPTSLILSGAMMMEYLGWRQAAELIRKAVAQTIAMQKVTPGLAPAATVLSTSQYSQLLVELINY